ncbi:OprD family outer membrane porin [Pseudomonas schmalbachii]|uniref:OprD family porin n=1 Tax=Pseudomonas schmalbachii TaxID=2816993 RepID=A0ABS3TMW3_9PSED|nr:OprD family outer membrane porin [Pseudomonas schmalbachii]MBO3274999.1 OprD family porin [Pseudomonas schmalbachii]
MRITNKGSWALVLSGSLGSVCTLAVADEPGGFVEDSSLKLLARNMAQQDDRHEPGVRDSKEWGQGLMGFFESGFTRGQVGFGVDAQAFQAIKLDGGGGTAGTGILPISEPDKNGYDYGKAPGDFSSAGAAVKMRLFDTLVKYGDQLLDNPVIGGDQRILPQTFRGISVTNEAIDGLSLDAGRVSFNRPYNQSGKRRLDTNYGEMPDGEQSRYLSWGGVNYAPAEGLTTSLYAGNLRDVWRQYYAAVDYQLALGEETSLASGVHYYNTRDRGDALLGEIGTNAYSASLGLTHARHTLTLVYQRVNGDTPFDYINGGGSIYLANSQQYSDFAGPHERSWKLQYDYDLSDYLDGLTAMASYSRGKLDMTRADADSPGYADWYNPDGKDASHWERDIALNYSVPSGTFKDLSVALEWAAHRTANGYSAVDDSVDEYRLTLEYPYDLL